ncbi:GDSL-type esterase/lipase family protein [Enterococcus viikkiensis]|uniref:GDSL-type esterase/lipase family protein n=1 Tax=Enterococcus viikkiensis TaxID=930854 RepID=UPI0010F7838F|nr:GDSL-type esterase/lipase family protein [Enterococcus viikkiensis]
MVWTTIWSHAQRGIARYASSTSGTIQLMMRQIVPAKKIRLVFANEYGGKIQHIQNLSFKTKDQIQKFPDFSIQPAEVFKTTAIRIDPSAKKWQLSFQTDSCESGFAFNDADFFPSAQTAVFCSGLTAIEAEIDGKCIIALGDSLTEGATWTAPLQRQLRKQSTFLVNQGVNGSYLLHAGSDQPASKPSEYFYGFDSLTRLRHCLKSHSNVSKVILFFGTNDLIEGQLTLENFQVKIKELIAVCQEQKIDYQLCTLAPCLGYPGMDGEKECLRQKINQWLRSESTELWDSAAMVEEQGKLKPVFDSGDHLHFNAAAGLTIARQISSDFVKGE